MMRRANLSQEQVHSSMLRNALFVDNRPNIDPKSQSTCMLIVYKCIPVRAKSAITSLDRLDRHWRSRRVARSHGIPQDKDDEEVLRR
jgi:hypothetical protein